MALNSKFASKGLGLIQVDSEDTDYFSLVLKLPFYVGFVLRQELEGVGDAKKTTLL